jgi:ribosomal-protein-alanine N-acetyltransferase
MNMDPTSPICGKRIRLRPLREADAKVAFGLLQDSEVRHFLNHSETPELEQLQELYREGERLLARKEAFYLAIEPTSGGPLAGTLGIRFPRHPQQANLGYWLGRPYWSQGWMTEAVELAVQSCFEFFHCVRVDANVRVGNDGSRRVLEKCGFQLDGTLRLNVLGEKGWQDEWMFTRVREGPQEGLD